MKEDISFKDKLVEFYEESKENINFKSQLILSLIQSIKEENNQFFSKSKHIKQLYLKYL
jgi:predicted DNA-binding ribbon-helix-helix protein